MKFEARLDRNDPTKLLLDVSASEEKTLIAFAEACNIYSAPPLRSDSGYTIFISGVDEEKYKAFCEKAMGEHAEFQALHTQATKKSEEETSYRKQLLDTTKVEKPSSKKSADENKSASITKVE